MNKALLFSSLMMLSISSFGQVTQEEKIEQIKRDQYQAEHSALMRQMEQGVELMAEEQYEAANTNFKHVLKNSKVVPTDLCFYFGKNSYYLGSYQQSIDWLNKYIELKGTSGRFYDECLLYLKKSNEGFLEARVEERKQAENILSKNYDIDCGPSGKVVCPVCQGKTVIITKTAFGDNYKACPYSDDHGYLTCQEYNQLLRGELEPK